MGEDKHHARFHPKSNGRQILTRYLVLWGGMIVVFGLLAKWLL